MLPSTLVSASVRRGMCCTTRDPDAGRLDAAVAGHSLSRFQVRTSTCSAGLTPTHSCKSKTNPRSRFQPEIRVISLRAPTTIGRRSPGHSGRSGNRRRLGWALQVDRLRADVKSGLVPGYPQDRSPEGTASPAKGMSTAADPVVRSGAGGLFSTASSRSIAAPTSVASSSLGSSTTTTRNPAIRFSTSVPRSSIPEAAVASSTRRRLRCGWCRARPATSTDR